MDKNKKKSINNPRQGAKLLSVLTFQWLFGTFLKGYKRELEISDLYSPLDEQSSQFLGNKMFRLWNQELEKCKNLKKTPSLLRVLVRCFGKDMIIFSLPLVFVEFVIKLSRPIILTNLLKYFCGNQAMELREAFYWCTAIVLGEFVDSLFNSFATHEFAHIGIKVKVACCSLIYRKILKVPKNVLEGKTNIGQMMNFLSNDVNKLKSVTRTLNYAWIAPVQTVYVAYLLYRDVGLAASGGIAILLLSIPIQGYCGKITAHLMTKVAYRTDQRVKLTSQIISSIKVIKMYAWEKPFTYLINKAREEELRAIKNNFTVSEISLYMKNYIVQICIFTTMLLYILSGKKIVAEKVYLIVTYFSILRRVLYFGFMISIKDCAESLVTVERLRTYLLLEEIKSKPFIDNNVNLKTNENISISFYNVTTKWNSESKINTLKQITFQLPSGSLTAIIGQIGTGKTTLFQAILQEMPDVRGEIKIKGNISYASQDPWLFASSIKQNILFGKLMDKARYEKVIEVCQLKRDFQLLPHGDNTLVGEKGFNLSGGQRARINLARAVYHEADIYLLDDPFSAVDTRVGNRIFNDCIKTFLKKKTVVLITHQFRYLNYVDKIIVLGNNTVLLDGTYHDLMNSELNLTKKMQNERAPNDALNSDEQTLAQEDAKISGRNINEEQMESNNKSTTLNTYIKAAQNNCLVFLIFLINIICQIIRRGTEYFLSYWSNVEEKGGIFIPDDGLFRGHQWYIYIYVSITLLSAVLIVMNINIFYHTCIIISKNLHVTMFTNIIRTKMAFFNANSVGCIINRFSKDLEIIDIQIPQAIFDLMELSLFIIILNIVIATVNPWFLIGALVTAAIAYVFRSFYIKTSRTIKRLERITQSPVLNHLSDTMHGLTTIRAFNAQQILINVFDGYQDIHSSTTFISTSGSIGFGTYMDFLCTTFTSAIYYALIFLSDITGPGDVGFIISQCTIMNKRMRHGVLQMTEIDNHLTSVERILEYSNLEQEPLFERKSGDKVHGKWPQRGQILFKDVNLTYNRQEKPALKNLNFTIESKEIIGIVGRTGAGKSSIINALFRLCDIQGEIYIDNVAISKIALQDLRSKISIIPQEPILFAGSLRQNLDPFEEYSDEELWEALKDIELKSFHQYYLGLNMEVSEGGTNFSVGQRQLLCLARAIVRNNNIIVLDEATANVDPQTAELIQKAVRKKFVNCTVLIIAHRLNAVVDTNKVLVMDAGRIVEFDHPYNLLQQRSGVFYNMVQQTGAIMAKNLFQVAKLNYESSQKHEKNQ